MSTTSTTHTQGQVRPFGMRDKIGYMFGDFGNDFSFLLASTFLAIFWTDVLGVSAAIGGTIMAFARLVDAFTDVGMGVIVDRAKTTAEGKFRPWIRRGMIPVAVASFLLYGTYAASWSDGAKIAYMTVTYLLWGSICYTFINIPYGSMASVVSPEANDRAQLSVFRSLGATLAQTIIQVSIPLFVNVVVEGKSTLSGPRMMIAAGVCAVLSVGCYYLCYRNVTERVVIPPKEKKKESNAPKVNIAVALVTNRSLLALILAALLLLFGSMLAMSVNNYLWKDYFNNFSLAAVANFISIVPIFLMAPFITRLTNRFGKKEVSVVATGISALMYFILYFIHLEQSSWIVFVVLNFFATIGLAGFNLIIWAFITDVIDAQEVATHSRDDGTVYAVYSWARKLGQALAALVAGVALSWVGYDATLAAAKQAQSQDTLNGIYMIATLVPGVLYLLVALTLLFLYPLSKAKVAANIAELKRRHEAMGASVPTK